MIQNSVSAKKGSERYSQLWPIDLVGRICMCGKSFSVLLHGRPTYSDTIKRNGQRELLLVGLNLGIAMIIHVMTCMMQGSSLDIVNF